MENTIIKEKIDVLVTKLEELGTQATQLKATRDSLVSLINSQKSINESYIDTLKKCDDYIDNITEKVDENVFSELENQLSKTKDLLKAWDNRNKEIINVIEPIINSVEKNYDEISQKLDNTLKNVEESFAMSNEKIDSSFETVTKGIKQNVDSLNNSIEVRNKEIINKIDKNNTNVSFAISQTKEDIESLKNLILSAFDGVIKQQEMANKEIQELKKNISKNRITNIIFFIILIIFLLGIIAIIFLK